MNTSLKNTDSLNLDDINLIDSFSRDTGVAAGIAQNIMVFKGLTKDYTIAPETWTDTFSKKGREDSYLAAEEPKLHQNVPNPASNHTTIKYALPKGANGTIILYDIQGRLIERYKIVEGEGRLNIDLTTLPHGIIIYKLRTDRYATISRKMVVQ